MGKKIKVYLDTSVVSALFDSRNPERRELTEMFFKNLENFEVFVSEVVFAEIDNIPDEDLRENMLKRIKNLKNLQMDTKIRSLAKEYVKEGAIPQSYSEDALHIAISTLNEMDYLLSWNFRHIVKMKTRKIVNMVNFNLGYPDLNISTPAEIL